MAGIRQQDQAVCKEMAERWQGVGSETRQGRLYWFKHVKSEDSTAKVLENMKVSGRSVGRQKDMEVHSVRQGPAGSE